VPLYIPGRGAPCADMLRAVHLRIVTILALALPATLLPAACERVECILHSDCPGGTCYDGSCTPPEDTDTDGRPASTSTTSGPSGGGDCHGYTFEAPPFTMQNWACEVKPLPYPLPTTVVVPSITVPSLESAQELHEAGVCSPGSSPTPGWPLAREALAESVFDQCMPVLLGSGVPGCVEQAETICTAQAMLYYMTIGSVPPLVDAPDLLVPGGVCEGGRTLYCDSGADTGSGG
jgi:hypothetical protein